MSERRYQYPLPIRLYERGGGCEAMLKSLYCTLTAGHPGPHSAGGPDQGDGTCQVFAEWDNESPERGVPRTYIARLDPECAGGDLLVTVYPGDDGIEVAPRIDETRWGAPLPVRRAE